MKSLLSIFVTIMIWYIIGSTIALVVLLIRVLILWLLEQRQSVIKIALTDVEGILYTEGDLTWNNLPGDEGVCKLAYCKKTIKDGKEIKNTGENPKNDGGINDEYII